MKHAIITGGTKGIGLGIAKMLLHEGYYVIMTYAHDDISALECKTILSSVSHNFEIVKVNQANKSDMSCFVRMIRNRELFVDCLICNAGATLRKEMTDIKDDEWERVMQINVNSYVYLIRDLYDRISKDSRIVFIGSLMAMLPHGTSLVYGVSKAAVHALALNLVKCFEDTGTTINVIAPGFVETEWQKKKPQEIRNNIYRKTAIKRFATVEEIADAVKFCINNAFVNGSVIEVSGGYSFK